jgi:ubiquinone/menaquinone biosynthesis C-methylase UbiE
MTTLDIEATMQTRDRYQRISSHYDLMEFLPEKKYHPWRQRLWSLVKGPNVLEVGVGTGKNIPFYPAGVKITAIDLTPGMIRYAQKNAEELGAGVEIDLGDVQALEFPDASFDTVVATFVFCSVPDPGLGLKEIKRVLKPDGQLLMLDHVRSENIVLGKVMDIINPIAVRVMGANINRKTVENVKNGGFKIEKAERIALGDIFRFIIAKP